MSFIKFHSMSRLKSYNFRNVKSLGILLFSPLASLCEYGNRFHNENAQKENIHEITEHTDEQQTLFSSYALQPKIEENQRKRKNALNMNNNLK